MKKYWEGKGRRRKGGKESNEEKEQKIEDSLDKKQSYLLGYIILKWTRNHPMLLHSLLETIMYSMSLPNSISSN